jgi:hypothetical protein
MINYLSLIFMKKFNLKNSYLIILKLIIWVINKLIFWIRIIYLN